MKEKEPKEGKSLGQNIKRDRAELKQLNSNPTELFSVIKHCADVPVPVVLPPTVSPATELSQLLAKYTPAYYVSAVYQNAGQIIAWMALAGRLATVFKGGDV